MNGRASGETATTTTTTAKGAEDDVSVRALCTVRTWVLIFAFLCLIGALLLGGLVLVWKGWVNGNSNGIYFKSGLLAYTIKDQNTLEETRENWRDCCTGPFFRLYQTKTTDLDAMDKAGRAAFGLIFAALMVGIVAAIMSVVVAMPAGYRCECSSASLHCEFVTLVILDGLGIVLGFLGFGVYATLVNGPKDRLMCIPPQCVGQEIGTRFGAAFITGGVAAALIATAFVIHLTYAFCNCGSQRSKSAADAIETSEDVDAGTSGDDETGTDAEDEDEDEDVEGSEDEDADEEGSEEEGSDE